jgi:hypothetical protein
VLGAEENYIRGMGVANDMQQSAANMRRQAGNIRMGGQRDLTAASNQYSDEANQVANAMSLSALGDSVNDFLKPTNDVDLTVGAKERQAQGLGFDFGASNNNAMGDNYNLGLDYSPFQPKKLPTFGDQFKGTTFSNSFMEEAMQGQSPLLLSRGMGGSAQSGSTSTLLRNAMNRKLPILRNRAMGGRVEAGQPYVVGDSPDGVPTGNEEVFVPDQDGTVVPSENTQARMGLAGDIINAIDATPDEITMKLLQGTGLETLLGVSRKKMRKRATALV